MKFLKKWYKDVNEYLYEHRKLKNFLEIIVTLCAAAFSAFLFEFGFKAFIQPYSDGTKEIPVFVSGAVSGVSQTLIKLYEIVTRTTISDSSFRVARSVLYFLINVPLFLLAFFKIGKKFALFTLANVFFVSIFGELIPRQLTDPFSVMNDDLLARAIFSGILTGLSCVVAVKFGHSTGGTDIVSIYFSNKSQSNMGKYMIIINGIIVISYTILNCIKTQDMSKVYTALYSIVYLFSSSKIIDAFVVRNRKVQLQIVTENEHLAEILISNFPHSATTIDAKGAYKGNAKKMIYMDVSLYETKQVTKVVKKADANAFVTIIPVHSVQGKFYIKPIE